jgi:hypothetical protein
VDNESCSVRLYIKWSTLVESEPQLLCLGVRDGVRIWRGFSVSLIGHALVAAFAFSDLQLFTTHQQAFLPEVQQARILEVSLDRASASIRLPARAEPAPSKRQSKSSRGGSRVQAPVEAAAAEGVSNAPAPSRTLSRGRAELRQFQMPPSRRVSQASETLVQLDLPPSPEIRQNLHVPSVVILSEKTRRIPAPFVRPPQRDPAPLPRESVLVLQPPVVDVGAGMVKTPLVMKETVPVLPIPAGARSPVANNRGAEVPKPASNLKGSQTDDADNVIVLPDRPIPFAATIVIPPLNEVAGGVGTAHTGMPEGTSSSKGAGGNNDIGLRTAGGLRADLTPGAGGRGGSGTGNSGEGRGPVSGTSTVAGLSSGSTQGTGAGSDRGSGTGSATGPAGGPGSSGTGPGGTGSGGPGAGAGSGGAGNGTGNGGNGATDRSKSPPTITRPITGQYEIVVVQSSGAIPGTTGMLSGRPVYTVYVPVGTGKGWVLQYCLPKGEETRAEASKVVQMGTVTPVTAPYAYSIIPPDVRFKLRVRYAFIHGFVNTSGRFQDLTEAGDPVIENLDGVIETLQQWMFRPATKDGAPAVVEILLCVPMVHS